MAAHGDLARGFGEAIELILGPQEQMAYLNLEPEMGPSELMEKMAAAIASVDSGEGVLICVDLFGGTPCNVALALTAETNSVCLTGINLGMLLEAVTLRGSGEGPISIANKLVETGKGGIQQVKIC
ncbi:MAG TPA: PTS sugar transporter subunit IIA [Bacillota bacterium]|nr:PTS sugar transporter subunit IIA [Bacillota bacterium]HPZ90454.1 PTS sugar transporter subunit IIA [Bacillota bacterium]